MSPSGTDPGTGVNVVRFAHVELGVTDLPRSRAWYVDCLGFVVTAEDARSIHLRGIEERCHHSLALRKAERPSVGHIAFRVAAPDDLERLERICAGDGLPTRWIEAGEEPGKGRALRVQEPDGPAARVLRADGLGGVDA